MSIDVSQFIDAFLEESFEGLDVMETGLLNLDAGDAETIHAIFRAAHSIKGGAGSFGLAEIADFTHGVETLLDEMRDGRRAVDPDLTTLLLDAVDMLREMMVATREKAPFDEQRIQALKQRIDTALHGGTAGEAVTASADVAGVSATGWEIRFRPYADLLRTGNDPVRMFDVLDELGELTVEADCERLPELGVMDPESSYLGWTLRLSGEGIEEAAIREVFEWVEDECDLEITPLSEQAAPEAVPDEAQATPVAEAPPPVAKTASQGAAPAARRTSAEASSIRVNIDKIDALINMVGELVITQSMLGQIGEDFEELVGEGSERIEKLREGLAQLERNTRELQENVMSIRMLPISFSFNRFPRLVRDLGSKLGKKIELKLSGEQTELDKTVMEKIGDPLVHLVRNSIDHGIEMPDARRDKGKPETGTLHLNAYHKGGNIVIEISDDGAGLNKDKILKKAIERGVVPPDANLPDGDIHELIFAPGFSTADEVSDLSGRGVGMDVVRRNIKALGGTVELRSEQDVGTTFTVRLPLTLAILDGQLVQVADETYVIPLVSIVESLQMRKEGIKRVAETGEVYRLRDEYIPVVRLREVFGVNGERASLDGALLVVVEAEGKRIGLVVDDLLSQQQVVIKALETNFRRVDGLSGATILGDGTVALILDVAGLVTLTRTRRNDSGLRLVGGHAA
jgi:two-component system chemotaxis sensor kinase CheA